jgi:hypothetical protein
MADLAGVQPERRSRFDRWLPVALAAVGPILLFGPMLARGEVLYWGTPLLQFVPWRVFAFEVIRQGWLPLWNPLVGMGAPLLANYQSALLYPPNWILSFTLAGWGEGLLVLAHLVFAGAGTVLVLRRLEVGPLGQAIGGVAFASGTFLVARAGFFSLNAAAAYLPWMVLCADMVAGAAQSALSIRWLPALAALSSVLGLQALAGHAQSMAYSLLLAVAWSLWKTAAAGGWRAVIRVVLMWLSAGLLGVALAGAQLVPTAEYLLESSRGAGVDETVALTYSFWPWRTLGLLLPGLFGSPVVGDYWGYANFWEDALYIGVLPLLMAITAALRAGRLGRAAGRLRYFLLAAAGLAFLFALGANTPLYPFLFRHVPLFGAFNAPTRFNLITTFCLALLAGIGAGLWARPGGRTLYWTRLGTAGAGAVLVLGLAATIAPTGLRESFGRSFAWAGLWLIVAGALALVWPSSVGRGWITVLSLVATLDLVVAGQGLNPSTSSNLYQGVTALSAEPGDGHRLYLLAKAERVLKFERTHRFDSFQSELEPRFIRRSGLPNTPMLDGLSSANNFDPLLPARYVAWLTALEEVTGAVRTERLQLMDVSRFTDAVSPEPPWVSYAPVPGAQRVRLVPEAVAASDLQEALRLIDSSGVDFGERVILETSVESPLARGGEGVASLTPSPDPNQVAVQVEAPDGGWLVLSDIWFPGWEVSIDGAAAVAYPADAAFRAVWVPPGSSSVVWRYQPVSFRVGVGLSMAGLTALVAAWMSWIVLRRRA